MREDRARLQKLNDSRFRQNTRLRASNETVAQAGFYFYRKYCTTYGAVIFT